MRKGKENLNQHQTIKDTQGKQFFSSFIIIQKAGVCWNQLTQKFYTALQPIFYQFQMEECCNNSAVRNIHFFIDLKEP